MVISDVMDPTLNHADGRIYDSKRAFQRGVRAAGCEIVGNERMPQRGRPVAPGLGRDIADVMRGRR
jgi:hypothetical protein